MTLEKKYNPKPKPESKEKRSSTQQRLMVREQWGKVSRWEAEFDTKAGSVALNTDVGLKRSNNQDAIGAIERNGSALFVLCDGMGGHASGEIASGLVTQRVISDFEIIKDPSDFNLEKSIRDAESIFNKAKPNSPYYIGGKEGKARGGTTFTSLKVEGDKAEISWIADSGVMIIRQGQVIFMTRPGALVQELYEEGSLTLSQAKKSRLGNQITDSVGSSKSFKKLHQENLDLQSGDKVIMYSDGLTDPLNLKVIPVDKDKNIDYQALNEQEGIQKIIIESGTSSDPKGINEALIALAKKEKSTDNISIVTYIHKGTPQRLKPKPEPVLPPKDYTQEEMMARFSNFEVMAIQKALGRKFLETLSKKIYVASENINFAAIVFRYFYNEIQTQLQRNKIKVFSQEKNPEKIKQNLVTVGLGTKDGQVDVAVINKIIELKLDRLQEEQQQRQEREQRETVAAAKEYLGSFTTRLQSLTADNGNNIHSEKDVITSTGRGKMGLSSNTHYILSKIGAYIESKIGYWNEHLPKKIATSIHDKMWVEMIPYLMKSTDKMTDELEVRIFPKGLDATIAELYDTSLGIDKQLVSGEFHLNYLRFSNVLEDNGITDFTIPPYVEPELILSKSVVAPSPSPLPPPTTPPPVAPPPPLPPLTPPPPPPSPKKSEPAKVAVEKDRVQDALLELSDIISGGQEDVEKYVKTKDKEKEQEKEASLNELVEGRVYIDDNNNLLRIESVIKEGDQNFVEFYSSKEDFLDVISLEDFTEYINSYKLIEETETGFPALTENELAQEIEKKSEFYEDRCRTAQHYDVYLAKLHQQQENLKKEIQDIAISNPSQLNDLSEDWQENKDSIQILKQIKQAAQEAGELTVGESYYRDSKTDYVFTLNEANESFEDQLKNIIYNKFKSENVKEIDLEKIVSIYDELLERFNRFEKYYENQIKEYRIKILTEPKETVLFYEESINYNTLLIDNLRRQKTELQKKRDNFNKAFDKKRDEENQEFQRKQNIEKAVNAMEKVLTTIEEKKKRLTNFRKLGTSVSRGEKKRNFNTLFKNIEQELKMISKENSRIEESFEGSVTDLDRSLELQERLDDIDSQFNNLNTFFSSSPRMNLFNPKQARKEKQAARRKRILDKQ